MNRNVVLIFWLFSVGGTETSARCKEKEAGNFRKAHRNTEGKLLKPEKDILLCLSTVMCQIIYWSWRTYIEC